MRKAGLVLAWLAAAAVVTTAAWRVVSAAQAQVSDEPLAPVVAVATGTTGPASPTTIAGTSTTPSLPGPTGSTTTTSPPSTAATASATTTATTAPSTSGSATIPSPGGTVTVSYSGGQVFLDGATPALGFTMEVEDQGPDEVRVDFESEAAEVRVRVRWREGGLDTEVRTSGEDD